MSKVFLPAEVKSALINVCGRAFWYKQPLFDIFDRADIPESLYLQYEHEPKFKIARQLLQGLEGMGDEGFLLQCKLLTELCKLRSLPDSEVPDRDAGLDALRTLKRLAVEHHLMTREVREQSSSRTSQAEERDRRVRERDAKLRQLYDIYRQACAAEDR
jgi:hypothetical protein